MDAYIVRSHELLSHAVERLCQNPHKGLVVVEDGKPVGVFTRHDMVKCSHCFGMHDVTIGEFSNKDFIYCVHQVSPELASSMHSLIPLVDDEGRLEAIFFPDNKQRRRHHPCPVVINAGGRGTRLYPYTETVPKPLVKILDEKPMVELIMDQFHKYGHSEFHMILNHKKEMIEDYFRRGTFPYQVEFHEEEKPLGTGGGLHFLRNRLSGTFFFTNCDIIMLENCDEVYEYHKQSGKIATMVASLKPINIPYGVIQTDEEQNLVSALEKPTYMTMVNTGIYVLEPDIFDYIKTDENIGFPDILDRVRADGNPVGIYPVTADRWLDMGQIDELEYAKKVLGEIIRREQGQSVSDVHHYKQPGTGGCSKQLSFK